MYKNHLSLWVVFLVIIFYGWLNLHWKNYRWGGTLSYDAAGYYMHLPAFFYGNYRQLDFVEQTVPKYPFIDNYGGITVAPNGNKVLKFPAGQAWMLLPGFVAGHFAAKFFSYPVDGFSLPYQFAVQWWCLCLVFIGLMFLRSSLLIFFADKPVALSIFSLGFATNLSLYATWAAPMTHSSLFVLYSIGLYAIAKFRHYRFPAAVAIGLVSGLATFIRPTEALFLFFVLLILPGTLRMWEWICFWHKHFRYFLLVVFVFLLVAPLQLIIWKAVGGKWYIKTYPDSNSLNLLRVHVFQCLFSPKAGWLVYTPLMMLALIGFGFGLLSNKKWFLPMLVYFVLCVWVVFSWNPWYYSGTGGFRALVQYYAVLAFPLSAFYEYLNKKSSAFPKIVVGSFVAVCVYYNFTILLTEIYNREDVTWSYWKRVFLKYRLPKHANRFLDAADEIPQSAESHLKAVFYSQRNFCVDATDTFKHIYSIAAQEKGDYVRLSSKVSIIAPITELWNAPRLYAKFYKGNSVVKEVSIRPSYQLWKVQKGEILFEADASQLSGKYDSCSIQLYRNKSGAICLDSLTVFVARKSANSRL